MRDNRKLSCQCLQESHELIHFFIGKCTTQLAFAHNPNRLLQSFCRPVVKIGISQFHIPKGCHPEYVPVSRVASDFVPAQICTFFIFCMGKRSKGSPTKKRAVVARDTASGFKKLKSGQLLCCQCILVSFKVVIKRRTMGNQCSLKRSDRLGQVIKRKWLFFVGGKLLQNMAGNQKPPVFPSPLPVSGPSPREPESGLQPAPPALQLSHPETGLSEKQHYRRLEYYAGPAGLVHQWLHLCDLCLPHQPGGSCYKR